MTIERCSPADYDVFSNADQIGVVQVWCVDLCSTAHLGPAGLVIQISQNGGGEVLQYRTGATSDLSAESPTYCRH